MVTRSLSCHNLVRNSKHVMNYKFRHDEKRHGQSHVDHQPWGTHNIESLRDDLAGASQGGGWMYNARIARIVELEPDQ